MTRLLLSVVGLLMLPYLAMADWRSDVGLVPEGYSMVSVSATARQNVTQDRLVASLRVEQKAETAQAVQDGINRLMRQAVEIAKKTEEAKHFTSGYQLYSHQPDYKRNEGKTIWQGSQQITIEGSNADAILKSVGHIQKLGFAMNGLNYVLSTELHEKISHELTDMAIANLHEKAKKIQRAIGKSGYELVDISVNQAGEYYPRPMPMMRAMAAMGEADMATPVASAGDSEVVLHVNARVLLKP